MGEKTLHDHERAHTGKTGMTPRHGQDAVGRPGSVLTVAGGPKRFSALEKAGQSYQPTNVYQKLNFGKDLP